MKITPLKTPTIHANEDLFAILGQALSSLKLQEKSVLAVTSKIISLCEGRVVSAADADRDQLVAQEADYYLGREHSKYGFCLSVNQHTLIASAGIDQSNIAEDFVLWPKDPQKSANLIREWLCEQFGLSHIGVILTDSHVLPLRWGTQGTAIAHSGFLALNDYRGKPDLFGRPMKVTRASIVEGLAAGAVVTMGEGSESTPLALVEDVPFVQFQDRNPTQEELDFLHISLEEDVFSPLLTSVRWQQGRR